MTLLTKWEGERQDAADLARKFLTTWVLASVSGGKPETIFFSVIERELSSIQRGSKLANEVVASNEIDILKSNVDVGIHTLGKSIVLVRRVPARQWHEGFCAGNSLVLVNGATIIPNFDHNLASQLYTEEKDIPLLEGLERVGPNQAVRLNSKYWILNQNKTVSLYRWRARVGSWSERQFYWVSNAKILKEEVKDELKYHA